MTSEDVIPFDRFWRAGHPMRPRTGRPRRWCMGSLLVVLLAVIGGYGYMTNPSRVREMAEGYLSQILGGEVRVRTATLSVFEGLRLDDVSLRMAGAPVDQPPIFAADTFVVRYSLRRMLAGRLEATQIIANRPHVQLTQDLDSLVRSYRRVMRDAPALARRTGAGRGDPPPLPQIVLRDARVDYRELRPDGTTSFGTLALGGEFLPAGGADRYDFFLQSRGISDAVGPYVNGSIFPRAGRATAQLRNFELGRDVRVMLPKPVREWWDAHELSGKVDVTELSYALPRGNDDARFTVRTALQGVTLTVRPGELMSTDEAQRVALIRGGIDAVASAYRAAGHVGAGPLAPVEALFASGPVRLDDMAGAFVFTDDGISVEGVRGDVEGNRIYIDGKIDGYPGRAGLPEPPGTLTITSGGRPISLPERLAYVNSLPRAVREIYDQLHPRGACTLDLRVGRPTPGGKIGVTGTIDVLDGNLTFLRFPYPVRTATGAITFAAADADAPERVEMNIRGLGIKGGPNERTVVTVAGLIGPLGPDAGVGIRVASDEVFSEDALRDAFPPDVQRTLKLFDAEGRGQFPTFRGRFTCDVNRAMGPYQPWKIYTHVTIDRASGMLAAFPYPLRDLAMELKIGDQQVEVINANMARGDARLRVDGKVSWGSPVAVRAGGGNVDRAVGDVARDDVGGVPGDADRPRRGAPVVARSGASAVTQLTISATGLPIDDDLLNALPPDRRQWLRAAGLAGKLDLSGTVRSDVNMTAPPSASAPADPAVPSAATPAPADASARVRYDLNVALRDGTVWPTTGAFVLAGVSGKLRMTPERIDIAGLTGTRGAGRVTVDGAVMFDPALACPDADLTVTATNLDLGAPLYAALPKAARRTWDDIRPRGTIDATVAYAGPLGPDDASAAPAAPTSRPVVRKRIEIRPRELSIHPKAFPYALDRMTGRVVIGDDGAVSLHHVTGRHGDALLSAWGTGRTAGDREVWAATLFARDVTPDDALLDALPPALAKSVRALALKGKVGWYFPRFVLTVPKARDDDESAGGADVDVAGKLTLSGADLDVGVPLTGVAGTVSGRAAVVAGKLSEAHGSIDFGALRIADRPATDFKAAFDRDAGSDVLRLSQMQAKLAGGDLAGAVTVTTPDAGPGSYAVDLVLRDADAARLAMTGKSDIRGRLSASLGLEGTFDAPASRRGRGDVLVAGRDMYSLPVVVGLLQITNLALPVATPFNQATARYSVDGQRVTFDDLSLRSDTMVMQGNGHLDFDTKKVNLTFTTNNPSAFRIPFLSDLWRGAQNELFKIEVRGTVQDPKVTAAALNTVTTSVDEVFNAGGKR